MPPLWFGLRWRLAPQSGACTEATPHLADGSVGFVFEIDGAIKVANGSRCPVVHGCHQWEQAFSFHGRHGLGWVAGCCSRRRQHGWHDIDDVPCCFPTKLQTNRRARLSVRGPNASAAPTDPPPLPSQPQWRLPCHIDVVVGTQVDEHRDHANMCNKHNSHCRCLCRRGVALHNDKSPQHHQKQPNTQHPTPNTQHRDDDGGGGDDAQNTQP